MRTGPRAPRGQAMVEYLVGGTLVLLLLAVPIDGHRSALAMLIEAIRHAYARFVTALALPV